VLSAEEAKDDARQIEILTQLLALERKKDKEIAALMAEQHRRDEQSLINEQVRRRELERQLEQHAQQRSIWRQRCLAAEESARRWRRHSNGAAILAQPVPQTAAVVRGHSEGGFLEETRFADRQQGIGARRMPPHRAPRTGCDVGVWVDLSGNEQYPTGTVRCLRENHPNCEEELAAAVAIFAAHLSGAQKRLSLADTMLRSTEGASLPLHTRSAVRRSTWALSRQSRQATSRQSSSARCGGATGRSVRSPQWRTCVV
jgi:hypothetical protein